ncbi:MAG TPA: biliverdin-producing heme oxygenase [Phycisphaerales bacterium]|nr:biliverdin-producing heme oxygenase [Phycisphaerales bacterium]
MTAVRTGAPVVVESPRDLLTELRERTKDLHTRAERHPIQASLVKGGATRQAYAAYLGQLLHIHAALESELAARGASPALAPVEAGQFRAGHAAADLRELGLDAPEEPVPPVVRFRDRVGSLDPLELLGMQYVLEGSTNGGRYIARAVGRGADLSPGAATRYLDPYGESQKERWAAFCAAAASLDIQAEEIESVVRGAEAMFQLIIDTFDAMVARTTGSSRPA